MNKYSHLNLPSGSLRVAVTNKCNMNCVYCHNEGQDKRFQEDMSFAVFAKIFDIAKKFGLRGISFTGGEPFLNKDLKKMVKYAIKNKLEKIDVCSNAILIKENLGILKMSKDISLAIGIDTIKEDEISKNSETGLPFKEIEENLFLLKSKKVKFSINTVYSGNDKKTLEIIKYCLNYGFTLRVIELDTKEQDFMSGIKFERFVKKAIKTLKVNSMTAYPVEDIYCKDANGTEIYFYNAKCHIRDCENCKKWTLRVNSLGEAIPCYAREEKYPISSENDFLRAIYNLGIPPEREKIW